jgi:hypothetical protein
LRILRLKKILRTQAFIQRTTKTIFSTKLKSMNAFLGKGIIIVLTLVYAAGNAQLNLSKYELGVTAGIFIYQGDLTPSRFGSFKTPAFAGNIFVNRIVNNSFLLRTNLAFGRIRGDDSKYSSPAWRQQRNFNFSSPVIEISEMLVYYPLRNDRTLSPYVFGGVGLSWLNVARDWSRFNGEYFATEPNVQAGLTQDASHAPPHLLPVIPLGVGIEYGMSKKLSVIAESSYRLTVNDYIDGFSKASNPAKFDHYQNYSVGVKYKFGKKSETDCPVVLQ